MKEMRSFWGKSLRGSVYHRVEDKTMTMCNSYPASALKLRYFKLPDIEVKICETCGNLFYKKYEGMRYG
jgi:hypothetical protein